MCRSCCCGLVKVNYQLTVGDVAVGGADGLVMSDFVLFFSPIFFCTLDLQLCIDWDVP